MASNAKKKVDAAGAALKRVAAKNEALANKLVNDFFAGGFKVTAPVSTDLQQIRAIR